jgi:hypothetical protein
LLLEKHLEFLKQVPKTEEVPQAWKPMARLHAWMKLVCSIKGLEQVYSSNSNSEARSLIKTLFTYFLLQVE